MSTQSTGPRSDEGKERSSLNATRHGLCSDRPVIPGENAAEWDAFRDSVVRRWLPAHPYEQELAERVALQMWRFHRVTTGNAWRAGLTLVTVDVFGLSLRRSRFLPMIGNHVEPVSLERSVVRIEQR
jgi:hypothetical protein